MPETLMTRIEFGSWAQGRAQPSGTSPGVTRTGSINMVSGKPEMVKKPDSGKTGGNMNLEWKIQTGRNSNRR